MATRIQVRRGTDAQWNTSNPTLDAGEFGFNTSTNQLKIGNGSTSWSGLDYFVSESSLNSSLGDYIELSDKGAANGVAELNASSNVLTSTSIIFEGATADEYETTLTVTDPTADRTITIPNSSGTIVVADVSGNVTISGNLTVTGTTTTVESTSVVQSLVFEGATADDYETTLTLVDPTADRTITLPNVSGTVVTTGNFPALTWGQVKLGGEI
jgi:hypothetical protein